MSFLCSDIIANARLRFNDLKDADALVYLKEVRAHVLGLLDFRKTTITNTSLVAGTAEYAYADTSMNFDQVRYVRSATDGDFKILRAITKDYLYAERPEWTMQEDGEPSEFYLTAGTTGPKIGLVPAPDTSTSGGYPKLEMDITQNETLTTGTTIYDDLPSASVYINGIKKRYAEDKHRDDIEVYTRLFKSDIAEAQRYRNNKNKQAPAKLRPAFMSRRTGVR